MNDFEMITKIGDLLRGKDSSVWCEILEKTLKHEDPYAIRVPQVPILDVNWREDVDPENLITALLAKPNMEIDEKIIAAFERIKRSSSFSFQKALRHHNGQVLVQFQPHAFGVEYDSYERDTFGANASISYPKVVEAALKYGFKQPDLISALYFRARFLDAHRYSEGTSYYVACKPLLYADDKPPIIPFLDYDRYRGWAIRGQEVDTPLDMSHGTGQGEHFESTFVFMLPRHRPI